MEQQKAGNKACRESRQAGQQKGCGRGCSPSSVNYLIGQEEQEVAIIQGKCGSSQKVAVAEQEINQ